ncbi:MAG: hypothetical protein N0E48_03070, partial [Candidatus Thiodiazotropha endolucinida]|nr:hypothetical protein [Candidatus Thiodiazotropha taylori]MCW4342344.1 hypothetical protein [Candidatus Thiodiazotropha endolucinida]
MDAPDELEDDDDGAGEAGLVGDSTRATGEGGGGEAGVRAANTAGTDAVGRCPVVGKTDSISCSSRVTRSSKSGYSSATRGSAT